LKPASVSTEILLQTLKLLHQQIVLTMFSCGVGNLKDLSVVKLISSPAI
jgi:isopentenyl diphosphate isomerase/L-lactate dehydrogenase-like FMN-dependent dehydrogenase